MWLFYHLRYQQFAQFTFVIGHYLREFTYVIVYYLRGQQLAQQMQSQNPDLVSQLREQMGRPPTEGQDGEGALPDPNQQPPPNPGQNI